MTKFYWPCSRTHFNPIFSLLPHRMNRLLRLQTFFGGKTCEPNYVDLESLQSTTGPSKPSTPTKASTPAAAPSPAPPPPEPTFVPQTVTKSETSTPKTTLPEPIRKPAFPEPEPEPISDDDRITESATRTFTNGIDQSGEVSRLREELAERDGRIRELEIEVEKLRSWEANVLGAVKSRVV